MKEKKPRKPGSARASAAQLAAMPEMKSRLLEAAHDILSREGPSALTTRRVCEAVGVTMPTLYHYFADRNELVRAVYDHAMQLFMSKKRGLKLTDDPLGDLRASCELVLDFVAKNKNAAVAVMAHGLEDPTMFAPGWALLRERVDRAATAGKLRCSASEVTAMTWAVVQGLVVLTIASPDAAAHLGATRARVLDSVFTAI